MMLTRRQRQAALVLHITTATGLLGAVSAALVLAVMGLTGALPAAAVYPAFEALTWWLILPLFAATLGIGTVQALTTPWGLLRHGWIVGKLALTVLSLLVLILQLRLIAEASRAAISGQLPDPEAQSAMVLHSMGGLAVLAIAAVLSVYKPGTRRTAAQARSNP